MGHAAEQQRGQIAAASRALDELDPTSVGELLRRLDGVLADVQAGQGQAAQRCTAKGPRLRNHQPTAGQAHVHAASAQQDVTRAKVPRRTGRRTIRPLVGQAMVH